MAVETPSKLSYTQGDYKHTPTMFTDAVWKGGPPGPGFVHPWMLAVFGGPTAKKAAGLGWGAVLYYLREAMQRSPELTADVREILAEVGER